MAGVSHAREVVRCGLRTPYVKHDPSAARGPQLRGGPSVVTSRRLERPAPSVECPRCGSALVVPALPGGPSEYVLQLRSGSAPTGESGPMGEWLCRSCGLRWPDDRSPAAAALAAAPEPVPTAISGEPIEPVELPEIQGSSGVTSARVASALREAREARGLTLSDAASATRIWDRYLQALESSAPLEEFPAPIYARSFLRAYAEFLGLETDAMVNRFDEDHPAEEDPILQPLPDPRPRRRAVVNALVFVSILALLAMAVARLEGGRDQAPAPSLRAASPDVSLGRSSVTRPPPAPPIEGLKAVLVLQDRCWVVAIADGTTLEQGRTVESGDRLVFRADRILELELGSAGAVELEVNGERVRTGSLGEVVRLELRLKDGEVDTTFV
jgi:cytoskeleton protein RodZ